MISIVCVYNNKEILDNFLLRSLKNQSVEYELILIDNSNNKYKSAAEALNEGGSKAQGKYIMFIHQDIDLRSDKWLEDVEKTLNSLEKLGIAGVAGRIKYQPGIVTNIEDGIPPKKISPQNLESPVKVQTLDECLIIIPEELFNTLKFDAETCDDWHLYATDYSLMVKKMRLNVYVIPNYLYHRSAGYSYSEGYDLTFKKILKKHLREGVINTTGKDLVTFYPMNIQKKWPNLQSITFSVLKRINY